MTECILPKIENKARMPCITTVIQPQTGNPN